MAKKITKADLNSFSLTGKIVDSPKKGFSKSKVYCDLNLKAIRIKNYITVRVYGTEADLIPTQFYRGDYVCVNGVFIETANGIERVVSKIERIETSGEFGTAPKEYQECVELYSPEKIDERKLKRATRTK